MRIRVVLASVTAAIGVHALLGVGLAHLARGQSLQLIPPAAPAHAAPAHAAAAAAPAGATPASATPPARHAVAPAAAAAALVTHSRKIHGARRRAPAAPPAQAAKPSPPLFDLDASGAATGGATAP